MLNLTKSVRLSAMAGLAMLIGAGAAHATPQTFTVYFPGPNLSDYQSTDWTGTQTLTVPKFDTSLGTLNSVVLSFTGAVTSSGLVENTSSTSTLHILGSTGNPGYVASTEIDLLPMGYSGPFDTTSADMNAILAAFVPLVSLHGVSINPLSSLAYSAPGTPVTTGCTTSSSSCVDNTLADYEGIGNLIFPLVTQTSQQTNTSGGNLVLTQTTSATAGLTITYNYTPSESPPTIPEPASLAVLGLGLASLGLIRRRKA